MSDPKPLTAEERAARMRRTIDHLRICEEQGWVTTPWEARWEATVRAVEAERDDQREAARVFHEALIVTSAERDALRERVERLRATIERVLADEEAGTGWGPDLTVAAYLRDAIADDDETRT